jgi:hypothetical protein
MARLRSAALLLLASALVGCFTVDATLRADGSGTIELGYIPTIPETTADTETTRFTSPHVTVLSVTPRDPGALLKATFDDATKLSTAEGFKNVTVRRRAKKGREQLTIIIRNPKPRPFKDEGQTWPRVTLTLPGHVLKASRNSRRLDRQVVWNVPLTEYAENPTTTLWVRYRVDAT